MVFLVLLSGLLAFGVWLWELGVSLDAADCAAVALALA
jgi:hypothetical protein